MRPAERQRDAKAIWAILEPVIRAGETYPLPRDMSEKAAMAYWLSSLHKTFVAEDLATGEVVGTYYIRPNNSGGGDHIANCGYMVARNMEGHGIARTMAETSIGQIRELGFRGIQFNFVVASNERAVGLWASLGFETLARLPGVFSHPRLGYVDALVMFRDLTRS
ncbi:MAG: GNAT family N-acetyltransferase [Hyphomicrobiaceae bacterium]|nr:GNAT family N-acetyltransferase [Hyphomicrobiaceae bacterium]